MDETRKPEPEVEVVESEVVPAVIPAAVPVEVEVEPEVDEGKLAEVVERAKVAPRQE